MINFKELEKFAALGKVATIVVMVDGKELFALSFTMDTLAYKEILEVAEKAEKVVIAEKVKEKIKPVEKEKVEVIIPEGTDLNDDVSTTDKNVDKETGEIKPVAAKSVEPVQAKSAEPKAKTTSATVSKTKETVDATALSGDVTKTEDDEW